MKVIFKFKDVLEIPKDALPTLEDDEIEAQKDVHHESII